MIVILLKPENEKQNYQFPGKLIKNSLWLERADDSLEGLQKYFEVV